MEHKERYFWNADLPAVIAEKVADVETFLRHWGRMWRSGVFQYRDLKFLVEHAPQPFKAQASALLLERHLDNYRLQFLAALAPEPYAAEARRRLGW